MKGFYKPSVCEGQVQCIVELTNRCEVRFPLRFLFDFLYLAFHEIAFERRLEDWGVVEGEFLMDSELSITLASGGYHQLGRLPNNKSSRPSFPFPLFRTKSERSEKVPLRIFTG
jgi:hypothetical protein